MFETHPLQVLEQRGDSFPPAGSTPALQPLGSTTLCAPGLFLETLLPIAQVQDPSPIYTTPMPQLSRYAVPGCSPLVCQPAKTQVALLHLPSSKPVFLSFFSSGL